LLATDRELLAAAPPLTLVSILGVWGALGREAWIVRLGVLAVSLPGIGASLGAYSVWVANRRGRGWNWNLLFPAMQSRESIEVAIIWAVLAGILLAGLLLVFRTSGSRLMQKTK
jgi:hypothetical protein